MGERRVPLDGIATVLIWQQNIGKTVLSQVPIRDAEVQELGDFELAGVTFPASEIVLEFFSSASGTSGDNEPLFAYQTVQTGASVECQHEARQVDRVVMSRIARVLMDGFVRVPKTWQRATTLALPLMGTLRGDQPCSFPWCPSAV